ncbi:MAG: hypothetical protein AB7I01_12980 [Gammaproteobacteria bacterium]
MTPELELPTDHLLRRLRSLTCLRLRAARRGDDGLAVLIGRERTACLEALRSATPAVRRIAA